MTRTEAMKPSVAIIGAGWAGLACALKLARAGFEPIVFESAPEPGGRARRAKLDDTYRDNGQHLMLGGCKALTSLFKEINVTLPSASFAYTDGVRALSLENHPGKTGLLRALLLAQGFTWSERFSLLRSLLMLHWRGWQVPMHQTVAQWLKARHQPATLISRFWAPLALAILNTPLEQASMARLAPVLRDTLGAGTAGFKILQPPNDLSASVVTPLVSALEAYGGQVHCGQRVNAIDVLADHRYKLSLKENTTQPSFDHVVLAVPPWSLAHITLPFEAITLANRFGAQPIATVYLGLEHDVRLPEPLVQLAGPTSDDARVWAVDRVHCGEPGVIAVSLSAAGAWTALDHETLASRCLENLQVVLGKTLQCSWHKVLTVHKATPTAAPTARLLAHQCQPCSGLWLTGDWTHPVYPATLEAAVATGFSTANEIITSKH